MVIVKVAGKQVGVVVDEVLGKDEIVIKSLGPYMRRVKLFPGTTIASGRQPHIAHRSQQARLRRVRRAACPVLGFAGGPGVRAWRGSRLRPVKFRRKLSIPLATSA